MTFDDVQEALVARGWRRHADSVGSPSAGFWFDRSTFDSDVRAVYYPAARRVHSFPNSPSAKELTTLLDVLRADRSLASLNDHLTAVHAQLASFASEHAMTLSLWALGYPSVRATARHPAGGIAVVECVAEEVPGVDVHAYHWIDDRAQRIRQSRRERFPRLFNSADLDTALGGALAFLLSPTLSSFDTTELAQAGESVRADDAAYWAEFPILR